MQMDQYANIFNAFGYRFIQRKHRYASTLPATCASINIGASIKRIPENVSVRARANVTAGLANEVEAVNQ